MMKNVVVTVLILAFQLKELCAIVETSDYGVDYSYPIHHYLDKKKSPRAKFYEDTIQGCYKDFSKRECDATERARLEMNLDQPAHQHNYTEIGFKKMKLPAAAWEPLLAFYEQNKNNQHLETWPRGYTYVNTWESPSYMISLEDRSLRGGLVVKQQVWDGVKAVIEEWTGKTITPTSMYGIRVYRDKAILATHVDRLPLVSSCIINVAQQTNEPWPIEVYDHNGKAHNVTMEPGDMVLYESHTVLHGRPFPMNGSFYANVFVHFQPVDHDEVNKKEQETAALKAQLTAAKQKKSSIADLFGRRKLPATPAKRKISGHEQDQHAEEDIKKHLADIEREEQQQLESHKKAKGEVSRPFSSGIDVAKSLDGIFPGASEEESEQQRQAEFDLEFYKDKKVLPKEQLVRRLAARGDLDNLVHLLKDSDPDLINNADENGWQAIHEAVRGGNLDVVKYLVESGADLGAKVHGGGSALWIARNTLDDEHEVTEYLVSIGAPDEDEL